MGGWGTGLFEDDMALDIKQEYQVLLAYGVPEEEAFKLVKDEYLLGDDSIFWLTVAAIQQKYGILMEEVKDNALRCIDDGIDIALWEGSGEKTIKKREKVLNDLRDKLLASPLPKRKVAKPFYQKPRWKLGDVVASQIVLSGYKDEWYYNKYVLYRVAYLETSSVSTLKPDLAYSESAFGALYDWVGDEIPDPAIIKNLDYYKCQALAKGGVKFGIHLALMSWIPRIERYTLLLRDSDYPMPSEEETFRTDTGSLHIFAQLHRNPHLKETYERLKTGGV